MKTPSLHIARLEAELAERCLELAEARQRINELEYAIEAHLVGKDECFDFDDLLLDAALE